LDHTWIVAAAEKNPDKWGKVTVGTHIPIISEDEARSAKPDYFLVLPWHFLQEFQAREKHYLMGGGRFIVPMPHFTLI
jgi:NDP-4-keto-2,6-dideoxyhexose 3-C-methyltransferase